MHIFFPGNKSPDELLAETAHHSEFFVEKVYSHVFEDGVLYFHIKKLGYPDYPATEDIAWSSYADCRFSTTIKEYMKLHKISTPVKHRVDSSLKSKSKSKSRR